MSGIIRPNCMLGDELPVTVNSCLMYAAGRVTTNIFNSNDTYNYKPDINYAAFAAASGGSFLDFTVASTFNLWTAVHIVSTYYNSGWLCATKLSKFNGSAFIEDPQTEMPPPYPLPWTPTKANPIWVRSFTNISPGRYRWELRGTGTNRAFGAAFVEKYSTEYYMYRKPDASLWVNNGTDWVAVGNGNPTDLQMVSYGMRRLANPTELYKLDPNLVSVEILSYTKPTAASVDIPMDKSLPNMNSCVVDLSTLGSITSMEVKV